MPVVGQLVGALVGAVPAIIEAGGRMGKRSRDKGARGEREVVRLLRDELRPGWNVERFGTGESGHDIRVTSPDGEPWPWAVEVKRYADFSVGEVLRGPSARWLEWWAQAVDQGERSSREPLLLTRGDRRPWWVWSRWDLGSLSGMSVQVSGSVSPVSSRPVMGHRLVEVLDELIVFDGREGA